MIRTRTTTVDGIRIFYREAGDPQRPTILLLHGFSSSSHMFRDLLPLLADRFHLVAPDYPGFGYSDTPPSDRFTPSFASLEVLMEHFAEQMRLRRFILYMQDFGGPVGFRMAVRHPDRIAGLIIQNANAYAEGLPAQATAAGDQPAQSTSAQVVNAGFIKFMYTNGTRDPAGLNPDAWTVDLAVLQGSEAKRIQSALIDDYSTNIALYPQWQAYMREHQPPALIAWGKNDRGFSAAGAEAYRRDLPQAKLEYFDTGHFALEEDAVGIARAIIRQFGQ